MTFWEWADKNPGEFEGLLILVFVGILLLAIIRTTGR